jgi:guanylate kinase
MPSIDLKAYCPDVGAAIAALTARGGVQDAVAPPPKDVVNRPTAFRGDGWRVSLRRLARGYDIVDIEVAYEGSEDRERAALVAAELRAALGIRDIDILPWSGEEIATLIAGARAWRRRFGDLSGRLFLIDGPSGAGKSTLVEALRDESRPGYMHVPRCTSRPRRPGEEATKEYVHLSVPDFRRQVAAGRFLEYRHFMFDMSYGLRWDDVAAALGSPGVRAAYALVNLGNIRHVRRLVPEATTILVVAPLEQIRQRLESRGTHTPEAIAERLSNARKAADAIEDSDYVLDNRDGRFVEALGELRRIVYGE